MGLFPPIRSAQNQARVDSPEPSDVVEKCLWKAGLPSNTLRENFSPQCAIEDNAVESVNRILTNDGKAGGFVI